MIFVFFCDGYADNGYIGMVECETRAEAARFIEGRMKLAEKPSINRYRVIDGRGLQPSAVEVATRIDIGH